MNINQMVSSSPYKKLLKKTEPPSSVVHDRRMRNNSHKLKQEVLSGYKEKLFHHEGSEALEYVAQRGYVVSILGDFQDWTR